MDAIRTNGYSPPAPKIDERQYMREYQAKRRASERDLRIPIPREPNRRLDCLADPELFLLTYFAETFYEPFTDDRRGMLMAIIHAAKYSGDYSAAGERSGGKSRIALYGSLYVMVAALSNFPLVVGKSQDKSANELRTAKQRLQQNKLFIADFPEVGIPFQSVGGWSSRGRMQTVAGIQTNIELGPHHFIFPTIERWQLPDNWPDSIEPCSRGQIMGSIGVDGPVRGTNYYDVRPTVAIVDDIESRETANSDAAIAANEDIIEKDIAGLGTGERRVSRALLCTIQNRKCIAYRYTDPKQKPSWKSHRFRRMVKLPDRMDMWTQYISLRVERDSEADPDARVAWRFYADNREAMDAGCVVSNLLSYNRRAAEDGEQIELSAIQAYFNLVADIGQDAVDAEYNSDPPEAKGPSGSGLTKEIVASRISGLARRQCPANAAVITAAIDLGKYACHWVIVAWWKGAGGCVLDYGVAEVLGTDQGMDNVASEPMIYRALLNWREELLATPIVDAAGAERTISAIYVDSGYSSDAAYEFVRQVGGKPFYVSKGMPNYRDKKSTDECKAGHQHRAQHLPAEKLWLYEINVDYWKGWTHERFLTPTFDEHNFLRRGALSLFVPIGNKNHLSFAQHIVAEELVTEFKDGKGTKTYWHKINANNHWLDALCYAACAASDFGIDIMTGTAANPDGPKVEPKKVDANKPKPVKPQQQHGRFKQRPGGWIQGMKRR